mmetsp:Transcript_5953/g.17664  ORF Transcript_5953/g.17664 Transcript_5953/m.17664 type:complete len:231 (-) Transcript_5953:287-979(-)
MRASRQCIALNARADAECERMCWDPKDRARAGRSRLGRDEGLGGLARLDPIVGHDVRHAGDGRAQLGRPLDGAHDHHVRHGAHAIGAHVREIALLDAPLELVAQQLREARLLVVVEARQHDRRLALARTAALAPGARRRVSAAALTARRARTAAALALLALGRGALCASRRLARRRLASRRLARRRLARRCLACRRRTRHRLAWRHLACRLCISLRARCCRGAHCTSALG